MHAFRSSLGLLLLAATLGGWIWWRERGPVASAGQQIVWKIDPAAVRSLRWQSSPERALRWEKRGSEWTISQEVLDGSSKPAVAADAEKVQDALSKIAALQSDVVLSDDPQKRREWGLERPQSTLSVDGKRLEFGRRAPFDARRIYARIEGQVVLLPSALLGVFARPLDDWRDRRVLAFNAADVVAFQIAAPAVQASFERHSRTSDQDAAGQSATEQWTIERPLRARADNANIETLLSSLQVATIDRFLDDSGRDPARWGLAHPSARIALTSGGQNLSLLIGRRIEGGYAAKSAQSPTVFRLADSLWTAINRPLRDWRDKTVLPLDVNAVAKIDISWQKRRAMLLKSGEGWQVTGGPIAVDSTRARNSAIELLGAVQTLRATDFTLPFPVTALDRTELRLNFRPSNQSLSFFHHRGKLYASSTSPRGFDNSLYLLPDNALQTFQAPLQRLFTKGKP